MDPYRFLPSERTATTIEEFLEGCRAEPTLAAEQLHHGHFEPWLRDAGRPDLAEAAAQVRQTDIAPAAALEQFLQTATRTPLRRRRPSSPARVRATAGRPPTHEETLKDAAPTEATGSQAADLPSITRLAPEEARRAFSPRRKLTVEQAREVTRLYAETDTPVGSIARQFGIGQSSIYRLAQQHGVPLRQAAAASAADDHTPAPAGAGRSRAARAGAVSPAAASGRGSRGRAPGTGATVRATSRVERRLVRAVTTAEAAPAAEPKVAAKSGQQSRSGGVGHRFQVTFLAETVVEAADIQSAIRQVEALGATDITAITREG
jgi:transposase-like protein